MLLGILEPTETVFLSTHLLEEVNGFISRAVLLKEGKILDDVSTLELDERGMSIIDYVKQCYHYQADRVSRALGRLTGEEDAP